MSLPVLRVTRSNRVVMLLLLGLISTQVFAGRVPTKYNDRYQSLYAEQELFRKRPELLGCVALAKDFAQTENTAVFNKLRFTAKSVQTAYVIEGSQASGPYQKVRIQGEGRVRAYSFFENWEPAVIDCEIPATGVPRVVLDMGRRQSPDSGSAGNMVTGVTKN